MSLSWFLPLLSLGLVLNTDRYCEAVPPCEYNWFGSQCRYECHCVNNLCDEYGACYWTSSCQRGWFGRDCQYVDLVATNTAFSTPAWVYDYPDTMCNPGQETVTVSLNGTFHFTWLRLRANAPVSPQDFTLQLMDANGIAVECSNIYTTSVNATSLDIHCQQGALFQKLHITGAGVKLLCSVMVKGDPPCLANWFGSPCRYECHCANNNCDKQGECTEISSCERGWFGPACQYVDLVATNTASSTPAWVYDYPDTLCNTYQETVTVSLDGTFYFTWLRLRANVKVSPQDVTLRLMDTNGVTVECGNIYTTSVSDTSLDMHCQQGAFFQKLQITGAGVKWLCSMMVSGGRNVALGQYTTQTSLLIDRNVFSSLAVDGDRNSNYFNWSCSHTDFNDSKPTWTLTFERPHQVNRYILYNRIGFEARLKGFILEADQENSRVAFTYTDRTNINHTIYRIPSTTPLIPVSSVNITATYRDVEGVFLTLCEVEMFGDTVCPSGYYGRNCEKSCNCARSGESCFVSTGGCPSGCAAGYKGEACQTPCVQGYLEDDCSQKCSSNCKNQLCHSSNGTCFSCIRGKQGPMCDKDCNPTFWGDNCATPCWLDCEYRVCNTVTGTCISCDAGKSGEYCDQACPTGTFGKDCKETCSINCFNQLCEAVSGTCPSCVSGWTGDYCDKGLPGAAIVLPVALIVILVVVFLVLGILIGTCVLIYRRCRQGNRATEQTNRHGSQNCAEPYIVPTLESNAVTTMTNNNVTGQTRHPVVQNPASNQNNNGGHVNHIGGNYYNHLPGPSVTAMRFDDRGNFMAAHRNELYQEQFNRNPANSGANRRVAQSPEYQNRNRY